MKYSISEASRIVGVTRKTLYKHIDKKPISVEKDDNDMPVIDASELIRVYGDKCRFDRDSTQDTQDDTPANTQVSTKVNSAGNADLAVTQKELEMIKTQMTSERDHFEEQIDYLRKKLDEANSETRKLTALITDQSSKDTKDSAWEKSIRALEQRIANQEKAAKEREEKEQKLLDENRRIKQAYSKQKKALEEEKSKSVWQRLFG